MTFDLDRYRRAQADPLHGFDVALAELRAGRKRSHWIWYVFPQLAGLGSSPMAVQYGLHGVDEAVAYLRDPTLRARLIAAAAAVAGQVTETAADTPPSTLRDVMGSDVDAHKLVSSMTLFGEVARLLSQRAGDLSERHAFDALAMHAGSILAAAATDAMPPCAFTRAALTRTPWGRED